jgi:ABC-2 type transport system permease protein
LKTAIRNTLIISKYTFFEVLKSKILLNVVFLGFALLVFSYAATEFTFGAPQKIALDFGLGALSFSTMGIAIFIGVSIINKEIESRTIYIILSQPLTRSAFLTGRILGMTMLLFLNILILAILTLIIYFIFGGEYQSLILWSVLYSFLESFIILNVAVLFSLITNVTMSVIYTIIIYISGHAINDVLNIVSSFKYEMLQYLCEGIAIVIPNFSKINIKDFVLYKSTLESSYLFGALAYGLFYAIILMTISSIIFHKKDLD